LAEPGQNVERGKDADLVAGLDGDVGLGVEIDIGGAAVGNDR